MEKRNKKVAKAILSTLTGLFHPPLSLDGHLDIAAFNALSEVENAKNRLRSCGYTSSKSLMADGFIAAGLVLKFKKGDN